MGTATPTCCGLLFLPLVETMTSPEAAPSGTRATMNWREPTITEPSNSPNRTTGRSAVAGVRPLPLIRTSPPGRANAGSIASMRGWPFTFFTPVRRSIFPANLLQFSPGSRQQPEMQQNLHHHQGVNTSPQVIDNNSRSFRQALQPANRRRLQDV